MKNSLTIRRSFPLSREEVFRYFMDPEQITEWAYPTGMSVTVPFFDGRIGGNYRYEHMAKDGIYEWNGNFEDIVPYERIVTIDSVRAPEGNTLFDRLCTVVTFQDERSGTLVTLEQYGFDNMNQIKAMKEAWEQSFDNLMEVINSKRFRPGQELRLRELRE